MKIQAVQGGQVTSRRPFKLLVVEIDSSTTNSRQTILTPRKGYRTRLVRVTVQQLATDGVHLWELYWGTAANIITDAPKGIDILAIPDEGRDRTATYPRYEGPRSLRDEVLSGRWRGTAPTGAHQVIIEYSEEP